MEQKTNEVLVKKDDGGFSGLTIEVKEDEKLSVPFALALDILEFSSPQTRRKAAESIYPPKELYRMLQHKKKSRKKGKFLRAYYWHIFHLCLLKEAMQNSAPPLIEGERNSHLIFQSLREAGFKAEHFIRQLNLNEEWQQKAKELCNQILAKYGEKFPSYEYSQPSKQKTSNPLGDW
jgi:hypothetical protein